MTKDEALSLKQSPYWESLCSEIERMIEGERVKLETTNPQDINIIIIQQYIKALKRMKTLPQDVIDRET